MSIQRKRRHHYVWQHYLRAWTTDNRVACMSGGEIFTAGTRDVAVERDFYKLHSPSDADLRFLLELCFSKRTKPRLREMNVGWLPFFFKIGDLERVADELPEEMQRAAKKSLSIARSNLEEDLHGYIERKSVPLLDALRSRDMSFLDDEDSRIQFLIFLCTQYFRTKKMRTSLIESVGEFASRTGADASALIAPMSHIFATNVASGIIDEWDSTTVLLLRNTGDTEFVTGDQPVINRAAATQGSSKPPDRLQLFYPVSPDTALILTPKGSQMHSRGTQDAKPESVHAANLTMASTASRQVYARKSETLEALRQHIRPSP